MKIVVAEKISSSAVELLRQEPHWTVITADGTLAAHWEHTIAVMPNGPRILTRSPELATADAA